MNLFLLVGECLITLSESLIETHRKGRAVAVLHYFGDLIANTTSPNSGFGTSVIYPIAEPISKLSNCGEEDSATVIETFHTEEQTVAPETTNADVNCENHAVDDAFEVEKETEVLDILEDKTGVADDNLMHALILALKYIVKDKQLPMLASTFWSILQRFVYSIRFYTHSQHGESI